LRRGGERGGERGHDHGRAERRPDHYREERVPYGDLTRAPPSYGDWRRTSDIAGTPPSYGDWRRTADIAGPRAMGPPPQQAHHQHQEMARYGHEQPPWPPPHLQQPRY
jgi:hypothetical protein